VSSRGRIALLLHPIDPELHACISGTRGRREAEGCSSAGVGSSRAEVGASSRSRKRASAEPTRSVVKKAAIGSSTWARVQATKADKS
jgi:hypothetical protein